MGVLCPVEVTEIILEALRFDQNSIDLFMAKSFGYDAFTFYGNHLVECSKKVFGQVSSQLIHDTFENTSPTLLEKYWDDFSELRGQILFFDS